MKAAKRRSSEIQSVFGATGALNFQKRHNCAEEKGRKGKKKVSNEIIPSLCQSRRNGGGERRGKKKGPADHLFLVAGWRAWLTEGGHLTGEKKGRLSGRRVGRQWRGEKKKEGERTISSFCRQRCRKLVPINRKRSGNGKGVLLFSRRLASERGK